MNNHHRLEIQDLSVDFETAGGMIPGLREVSFTIGAGHNLAVVGESGSGKSTTASCVNGLLAANGSITAGSILFEGKDLCTMSPREMRSIRGREIGLVPQDPMSNLDPLQRVGRQIKEALKVHGLRGKAQVEERVVELLDMVGIPEPRRRAKQFPHELSGGMRQRVLIAIGMACRPKLLIADEPTSALDVTVQRSILERMEELAEQMGTALLMITHDLELAAEHSDYVVVMKNGRVVEEGSAKHLLRSPSHDYTRKLIQASPSLDSEPLVKVRGEDQSEDPLLVVDSLKKVYRTRGGGGGFTAVEDSSFVIREGETIAIVGESGSGKSTTAKMVLGLEVPTEGDVLLRGTSLAKMQGRSLVDFRRRVQPVFQNPYGSLDPYFTVRDSIKEPLDIHEIGNPAQRQERVRCLLDLVALPPTLADRLPSELSGGQRQRVAIARALALDPELVVLDEAVSALDVVVQKQVLELLVRLQEELGLSYLFISHDLAVVRLISHRVHVMNQGYIIESGHPNTIFSAPKEEYTRKLVSAVPGGRDSTLVH
ncbi:dipeptide ABC transporter ATP-binding protein [Nesterenkonia populi]|uniref:dipeptide ABC transporter ATP-binding protein n=1 Tax=Nesterenkonia populi TaxID=1591087 RepID=UPI0011BD4D09|nr:ABC transporter ATP-binding protein [Nesterenkonia populi]